MATARLIAGDCRVVMAAMEAESVDAVVCDPPYNLAFMNKDFDKIGTPQEFQAWCESWARECLRVLRPGGHLVAMGGTRTYHRLTSGIEDAGFEIRDAIGNIALLGWIHGQGFPKSLDVGKALDKMAGAEREVVCESQYNNRRPNPPRSELYAQAGHKANITALATDLARRWDGWGTALKPAWEPIVLARKPLIGTVAANVVAHGTGGINVDGCRIEGAERPHIESKAELSLNVYGDGMNGSRAIGTTNLGRWPANLILSHTSECREVGVRRAKSNGAFPKEEIRREKVGSVPLGTDSFNPERIEYADPDGTELVAAWDCARDPETGEYVCPVALLDRMSRERRPSGKYDRRIVGPMSGAASIPLDSLNNRQYTDVGGSSRFFLNVPPDDPATRFFYAPKASRAERNRGLEGTPETTVDDGRQAPTDNPFLRGETLRRNAHPTVKPLALMRWLVRLVTPPGGLVLDLFCGSGTTGVACALEGFGFLGIDEDAEGQGYLDIAARRIADAQGAIFADVEVVQFAPSTPEPS